MSLPSNLTTLSREQIERLLAEGVFEVNLLMRALCLMGVPVNADLVDRSDVVYPKGRPEFIVTVGHDGD